MVTPNWNPEEPYFKAKEPERAQGNTVSKELIARLEKATGPDRELDREIKITHTAHLIVGGSNVIEVTKSAGGNLFALALPYTALIDAALTLVPDKHTWLVQHLGELPEAVLYGPSKQCAISFGLGATPAIALCIAALKARLATGPTDTHYDSVNEQRADDNV